MKFTHPEFLLTNNISTVKPESLKLLGVKKFEEIAWQLGRSIKENDSESAYKSLEDSFAQLDYSDKIKFANELLSLNLRLLPVLNKQGRTIDTKANPAFRIIWQNIKENHPINSDIANIASKILGLKEINALLVANDSEVTNRMGDHYFAQIASEKTELCDATYKLISSRLNPKDPALQALAKERLLSGVPVVPLEQLTELSFNSSELEKLIRDANLSLTNIQSKDPDHYPDEVTERDIPSLKTVFQFLTHHLSLVDTRVRNILVKILDHKDTRKMIVNGSDSPKPDLLPEKLRSSTDQGIIEEEVRAWVEKMQESLLLE